MPTLSCHPDTAVTPNAASTSCTAAGEPRTSGPVRQPCAHAQPGSYGNKLRPVPRRPPVRKQTTMRLLMLANSQADARNKPLCPTARREMATGQRPTPQLRPQKPATSLTSTPLSITPLMVQPEGIRPLWPLLDPRDRRGPGVRPSGLAVS